MGFIETKEHLDKVVDRLDGLKGLEQYNSQIVFDLCSGYESGILVIDGLEILASEVGEKLFTEELENKEYFDFKIYFEYRGYKFFSFCRKSELDACV